MSKIVTNEDGTEEEVFTAEEIEAQKQEAIEQFKLENPDKSEELTQLQAELEKYKSVDKSVSHFKKEAEEANRKVEDILKGVDAKIAQVKNEVLEGVMKDHYNETLKVLAGEDEEVKKKIEYHYKRLGDTAGTKEELTNKLKDAYVLATTKEPDGMNASIYGSGNVGRLKINNTSPQFSAEEQALGAKFGLGAEDFKGK